MDRLMVEVRQENRRVMQFLRENVLFMWAVFKLFMVNVSHLSCFYACYMFIKIVGEYQITGVQFMQFLGIYIGVIIVGVIMVLACVSDMLVDRQAKPAELDENVYTENFVIDIYEPVYNLDQDFINNIERKND
jgi:hypothetical protein